MRKMRLISESKAFASTNCLNFPFAIKACLLLALSLQNCCTVHGHGRLMEPPNRSSIFRFPEFEKYKPEKNWDDNQLWCGGVTVQYKENGGKCGPCGDNYQDKRPRQNENGGLYGRGIIVRSYKPGQIIKVDVELTTNHQGHFEFSLCPLADSLALEEEECFEQYPLALGDGSGYRYKLARNDSGWFSTTVKLPPGLTSPNAVLRWHYRTGNRWNWMDDNHNTGGLGHGDQEVFRGCADIYIGNHKPNMPRPPDSDTNITTTTRRPIATSSTTRRPGTSAITSLPPRPTPSTERPASAPKPKPSKPNAQAKPKPPMQRPPKTTTPIPTTVPSTTQATTPRTIATTTPRPSSTTVALPAAPTAATTTASPASSSQSPSGSESSRPRPGPPMMRPPAKEAPKNKQLYF